MSRTLGPDAAREEREGSFRERPIDAIFPRVRMAGGRGIERHTFLEVHRGRLLSACCAVAPLCLVAVPSPVEAQKADQTKIAQALGAAPSGVTDAATVLDWPSEEAGDFRVLREGSNGWSCLPDHPGTSNFDPVCNDAEWMEWVKAYGSGKAPRVEGVGVSYMLNARWATSNADPTATSPTDDNEWAEGGAHMMVIVPDPAMLDEYPDDPSSDHPYVMWKGTPYVHLMIPMEELASSSGG